jgi:hypothetical protein
MPIGAVMNETSDGQAVIWEKFGAGYAPPEAGTRVGIALHTLGRVPLNGLRLAPGPGTSGWFIWAGEKASDDPDFYSPLCIDHLTERCPLVLPFLALPPGWRFLTDGDYVDVWFDAGLLETDRGAFREL